MHLHDEHAAEARLCQTSLSKPGHITVVIDPLNLAIDKSIPVISCTHSFGIL